LQQLISTREAAQRLGVSQRRILALIAEGRLPAYKLGPAWAIQGEDLAALVIYPPHRPSGNARKKSKVFSQKA